MSYLLPGFLAQHFRNTDNAWQFRGELIKKTDKDGRSVDGALDNLRRNGHLERQGGSYRAQYRIRPDALHMLVLTQSKRTLEQIVRSFCLKWHVKEPWQATERNHKALDEWIQLMGNRI